MPLRDDLTHAPRRTYGTYRCAAYKEGGAAATGPHVTLKEALVDDYVTDVLLTAMQLPDAVTLFAAPGDKVDIPALKERLGLLESALAN